jgi:hypothetical protein
MFLRPACPQEVPEEEEQVGDRIEEVYLDLIYRRDYTNEYRRNMLGFRKQTMMQWRVLTMIWRITGTIALRHNPTSKASIIRAPTLTIRALEKRLLGQC